MQEKFDDARAIAIQVLFQIHNRTETLLPNPVPFQQFLREVFGAQNFRMHPHHQHLLVVRAVENADAPALGQATCRAPEKIVLQFRGAGMLEAEDLATLRIDAGHDVLDGAVLAGGVHGLKNQQDGVAVAGIKQALERAQFLDVAGEDFLVILLRLVEWLHFRRPLFELHLFAFANAELFWNDFHLTA